MALSAALCLSLLTLVLWRRQPGGDDQCGWRARKPGLSLIRGALLCARQRASRRDTCRRPHLLAGGRLARLSLYPGLSMAFGCKLRASAMDRTERLSSGWIYCDVMMALCSPPFPFFFEI